MIRLLNEILYRIAKINRWKGVVFLIFYSLNIRYKWDFEEVNRLINQSQEYSTTSIASFWTLFITFYF